MTDKQIKIRFIDDPGHGWYECRADVARRLGLEEYSASRGGHRYYEEDCEAQELFDALKQAGYAPQVESHYVDNFDEWIAGSEWPKAKSYGDCGL